ncbi:MAG: phosphoglucosamine mutase [Methanomicrobiales archaeon]
MTRNKLQKRLFGTNGARGEVGRDMTPDLILSIGMALAAMRGGTIATGRDTRTSGPALSAAVRAGIMAGGSDVVDYGVLPTPALQFLVRDTADAGAMITASHNPPQYNGIKIIEPDGTEMGDQEVLELEALIYDTPPDSVPWDETGRETTDPESIGRYIDAIVDHVPAGIGEGLTVVVDPGSGPAVHTTPEILSRLGCTVHTVNGTPDGRFPGRLPEPSPDGLAALASMVRETGADFGVAHDGDADRAVFVDENGEYIEENKEFAIIARQVCRGRAGLVVTPVSTSRLVEDVITEMGSRVVATPVGSIYVARRMRRLIEEGEAVIFGGEGNGGLIYPDHQFCRDGGMTAAMMAVILADARRPLSGLAENLPSYHLIKDRIDVPDPGRLMERLDRAFSPEEIDRTDGIKIRRDDVSLLVRPSGTEPILRVMVESPREDAARAAYREIMDILTG